MVEIDGKRFAKSCYVESLLQCMKYCRDKTYFIVAGIMVSIIVKQSTEIWQNAKLIFLRILPAVLRYYSYRSRYFFLNITLIKLRRCPEGH